MYKCNGYQSSAEGLVMWSPSMSLPSIHIKLFWFLVITAGDWVHLTEWRAEFLLPLFIRMLTVSPSVFFSLEENWLPLVLPKLLDSKYSKPTHTRCSSVKSLLKLNSCCGPENCRWPCSQGTYLITARARSRKPSYHLMRTFGTSWR